MRRLRPAMCNGIFNQKWCNTRAWCDDIGDTFLMNNKVAHCKEERKIFYYMYEGISVKIMKKKKKLLEIVCEVMLSIDVWIFQCEFSLSHSQRRCVDLFFPWKCGRMTSTKTACISPCQWHAHEWHYFLYTILFTIKKPSVFLNLLLALSHSLSLTR